MLVASLLQRANRSQHTFCANQHHSQAHADNIFLDLRERGENPGRRRNPYPPPGLPPGARRADHGQRAGRGIRPGATSLLDPGPRAADPAALRSAVLCHSTEAPRGPGRRRPSGEGPVGRRHVPQEEVRYGEGPSRACFRRRGEEYCSARAMSHLTARVRWGRPNRWAGYSAEPPSTGSSSHG